MLNKVAPDDEVVKFVKKHNKSLDFSSEIL